VLHSFNSVDGANPEYAGVIRDPAGNLYGTTSWSNRTNTFGTVFKINPSGKETILHNFTSGNG